MKHSLSLYLILFILVFSNTVFAQKNNSRKPVNSKNASKKGVPAIVVDRRLSVLRDSPSLYAMPIQRLTVGRRISVLGERFNDGVEFYQVRISANTVGWMQSEAVIGSFKKDDDQRLAKLIQAADNFDKIDKVAIFLEQFPKSTLRPTILLLLGDLIEEEAIELSKIAAKRLDLGEMAASGAPLHSFYLNFPSLDRYRKLGIRFLFNINTKYYHYDGNSWLEIVRKFPDSSEASEANMRLEILKQKMSKN